MKLTDLSDDDLLARIRGICEERQRLLAQLVAALVEVEERRLHLRTACPSVFEFCKQELGMSEGAAFRRSVAAHLVRRFPSLLGAIERGAIHLSIVCLLRDHLTSENADSLVAACAGKSTRQVQEMLAARAPRPDVPGAMNAVAAQVPLATAAPAAGPHAPEPPPRVAPLSEERFELRMTIGRELRDKIQHARDLMRHANPTDDLERVLEHAVDALVEKLEKTRLAKTERPQKKERASQAGRISAAVRRAVFERDGTRCTYVDARGKRCTCTSWLELDHVVPRADGGADSLENLRVRCRAHNLLWAEERFGKEHVAGAIALRQATPKWDHDAAELVVRGLENLGFKSRDATRAVEHVAEAHADDSTAPPKEEILREALALLT